MMPRALIGRMALVMLLSIVWAPLSAKVYLVAVGISQYPTKEMCLTLPAKDANTIAWIYNQNGDAEYKLLTNEKCTYKNILTAMEQTFAKAKEDDIVAFFFSGHGYKGGLVAYDKTIPYKKIREVLAKSKCKNKMIFADACFSGAIRTNKKKVDKDDKDKQKANVMLFLSSRDYEVSRERRDMKNGYFTTYLQKGLRGNADKNKDRVITATELFDYVSKGVAKLSDDRQHPTIWGNFDKDMPVLIW